jgi:hypothetical protein
MELNEFIKDKQIDPTQLDMECVKQPERFFHYAQESVKANHELDKAKLHLDVVKAKLDLQCRQSPEDFGLVKPTESAVNAAVLCHALTLKAHEALLEARMNAKLLEAAVDAMEQKKRMLEIMVTLHGQQYFAGPSVPHDLVKDWQEYQEQLGKDVNEKQKTRTRTRERDE